MMAGPLLRDPGGLPLPGPASTRTWAAHPSYGHSLAVGAVPWRGAEDLSRCLCRCSPAWRQGDAGHHGNHLAGISQSPDQPLPAKPKFTPRSAALARPTG